MSLIRSKSKTKLPAYNYYLPFQKFKLISDILIARADTWSISPTFYAHLLETGNAERILSAIDYHLPAETKYTRVKVNIFEGII